MWQFKGVVFKYETGNYTLFVRLVFSSYSLESTVSNGPKTICRKPIAAEKRNTVCWFLDIVSLDPSFAHEKKN